MTELSLYSFILRTTDPMKPTTKRILLIVLALGVTVSLALPKILATSKKEAEGAAANGRGGSARPAAALSVEAVVASPTILDNNLEVTGTMLANESVELRSQVAGRITRLTFTEGENVGKGTLLVKVDDSELRARMQSAVYRRDLLAAQEARQRQLLDRQAVGKAEYDVALSDLNTARADIALIRAQIALTEIRAPFAGRIGLRSVSQGGYVTSGTSIATLYSVNPIKIDFSVPERYADAVRAGTTVTIRVDASGDTLSARIYAVEPQINQETRTLQVRAVAPNPGGRLQPGAFARVALPLELGERAILLPTEAVVPGTNSASVFVARGGKVESRTVKIGVRTERSVQILDGVAAGDTVLVTGILQAKPGAPVTVSRVRPL